MVYRCNFLLHILCVKYTKLESITRSSLGCTSQGFYDINIKGSIIWRAYYFTCIISLNSHDMRVCCHEDILSLLYGWINRIKEKLHNSSELMGRRSGNNKWTQVSLTPECRRPTVTRQWTLSLGKAIAWVAPCHQALCSWRTQLASLATPLWDRRTEARLDFYPSTSLGLIFRVVDVCPEMTWAHIWIWIFWNISPVNFASGTPADNTRVSTLGPQDNVFQQMRNLLAGNL